MPGKTRAEKTSAQAKTGKTPYRVKADSIEACNCQHGCNCQFGGYPNEGKCEAIIGFEVKAGRFGNVLGIFDLRQRSAAVACESYLLNLTFLFFPPGDQRPKAQLGGPPGRSAPIRPGSVRKYPSCERRKQTLWLGAGLRKDRAARGCGGPIRPDARVERRRGCSLLRDDLCTVGRYYSRPRLA